MECPSCGVEMKEGEGKCPSCGFNLELKEVIGTIKRVDYLIERKKGGKFLYSNFKAMQEIGIMPFKRIGPIRSKLGDKVHITFLISRYLSMACLYPIFIYDFYKFGKLLGYYGIGDLPVEVFGRVGSVLKKSKFALFESKIFQETLSFGWTRVGGGTLEFIDADESKGELRYKLLRSSVFPSEKKLRNPACFIQLGALCGIIEAISGRFCDGIETKCAGMGDPHCEFDLYLHDGERHPKFGLLTNEELEMSLNFIIDTMVKEKKNLRENAGDYAHMSMDQGLNYMILSISGGHIILSKWSGRVVGEKLMEVKGIREVSGALDYLGDLFFDLKVGIVEKEVLPDIIKIKIEEPVYSSGVKNVHMRLCTFIAGILEGSLYKSSGEDWVVEETKCIGNGDGSCEFECERSGKL